MDPKSSTAAHYRCLPMPSCSSLLCSWQAVHQATATGLAEATPCLSQLQVLGAKRKNLAGYSTASVQPHQGFVFQSDIVQQTPPAFRKKAAKVVGSKCTLLARMDAYGQDPSGGAGQQMKVGGPLKTLSCISSQVDQ